MKKKRYRQGGCAKHALGVTMLVMYKYIYKLYIYIYTLKNYIRSHKLTKVLGEDVSSKRQYHISLFPENTC